MNNPAFKEWLVVVNPNAGNRKGKKDWEKISYFLNQQDLSYTERFTSRKGHAIHLTLEGIEAGFRKIIAVGGDGTLNEVVNGILTNSFCSSRDITIGLIPVGTGNDWGRMFGIYPDYEKAIKVITEGKVMLHDAGIVYFNEGGEKKHRYFINIAGLGFESLVVKRSNFQKDKGYNSKAIYLLNLLISLLSYKNCKTEIVIDGKKITKDVFSINVGNGRYCGGGMRQTPEALPDDGLLDVTVIREIGKIEIIRNLKMLYDGSILSHPKVDGYRCKNITVNSESIMFAEADGELLGQTPVEFSIIPLCINIIYSKKTIP